MELCGTGSIEVNVLASSTDDICQSWWLTLVCVYGQLCVGDQFTAYSISIHNFNALHIIIKTQFFMWMMSNREVTVYTLFSL